MGGVSTHLLGYVFHELKFYSIGIYSTYEAIFSELGSPEL